MNKKLIEEARKKGRAIVEITPREFAMAEELKLPDGRILVYPNVDIAGTGMGFDKATGEVVEIQLINQILN